MNVIVFGNFFGTHCCIKICFLVPVLMSVKKCGTLGKALRMGIYALYVLKCRPRLCKEAMSYLHISLSHYVIIKFLQKIISIINHSC